MNQKLSLKLRGHIVETGKINNNTGTPKNSVVVNALFKRYSTSSCTHLSEISSLSVHPQEGKAISHILFV